MLTPIRVILISLTVHRVYAAGEPPEDKILFLPWFQKCRCAPSCWCMSTSLMYALIDESAFQVRVHWHYALPKAIWMGTYLHGRAPQMLTTL
jgi:hypothetical protein